MLVNTQLKVSSIRITCVLCALSILAGAVPASAKVTWVRVGHLARLRAERKEYDEALRAYDLAIEMAAKDPSVPEAQVNLKLCLAETLRLAKKYEDSAAVLDSIELQATEAAAGDPLLPARFWARKAKLEFDLKHADRAVDCLRRELDCKGKCWRHDSDEYVKSWLNYLFRLYESGDSKRIGPLVESFIVENRQYIASNKRIKGAVDAGQSMLLQAAMRATDHLQLQEAFDLLCALDRVSIKPADSIHMWWGLLDKCRQSGSLGSSILARTARDYSELATRSEPSNSATPLPGHIHAHLVALSAFAFERKLRRAVEQWRSINSHFERLGPSRFSQKMMVLDRCMASNIVYHILNEFNGNPQLKQAFMDELSVGDLKLIKDTGAVDLDESCVAPHLTLLLQLSRLMLTKGRPDEEEYILSLLRKFVSARGGSLDIHKPLAVDTVSLGQLYLDKGDRVRALKEYNNAVAATRYHQGKPADLAVIKVVNDFGKRLGVSPAELIPYSKPMAKAVGPRSTECPGGKTK